MEYVHETYKKVKDALPTLTATQYDYYKDINMPVARTIMNRTGKTWNEILQDIQLPKPLSRNTLARLSDSLHFLEKMMKEQLAIGWQEKSFEIKGKRFRPDSSFMERMLVNDGRLFILDVKLCVSSSTFVIYKYLPLFQDENFIIAEQEQITFFSDWLMPEAIEKPFVHYDNEGQTSMALKNNILYISYLVGKPKPDVFPSSTISGKYSEKKRKIPDNMEIRYVDFFDLPFLYADLANIDYDLKKMKSILKIASDIKEIVLKLPENAKEMAEEIAAKIKISH